LGNQQGSYFSKLEKDLTKMQQDTMQETERLYLTHHHQLINPSGMHLPNLGGHHNKKNQSNMNNSNLLKKDNAKRVNNQKLGSTLSVPVNKQNDSHSTNFYDGQSHPLHHMPP
jgi:hypothetical protein